MSDQELFRIYIGDSETPQEVIVNTKDTGFQITNSLATQLGIFGKKVTCIIKTHTRDEDFAPERELRSYKNIESLQLKLEDFDDIASPNSRRPSILSSIRNQKSSRFNSLLVPKNITTAEPSFGMEKKRSIFTVPEAGTYSYTTDEQQASQKPSRRTSSLKSPTILNGLMKLISSDRQSPTALERIEGSDLDILRFCNSEFASELQSLVDVVQPSVLPTVATKSQPVLESTVLDSPTMRPRHKSLMRASTLMRASHSLNFTQKSQTESFQNTNYCTLRLNLPGDAKTVVRLPEQITMESVVIYICEKRSFESELYKFVVSNTNANVELDRTLGYYINEMMVTEMSLVIGEKIFTTMIEKEDGSDVMIYQYVQEKIHVIAATLRKIIERITDIEFTDTKFINMALLTFRSYSTPVEFFLLLLNRFDCVLPLDPTQEDIEYFERMQIPTQKRAIDVILLWVEQYWQDFALNDQLKKELGDFAKKLEQSKSFLSESQKLRRLVVIQSTEFDIILSSHKAVERKGKKMESMFEKMTSDVIGEQLCLYNFQLFRNIHSVEYLYQIWSPQKPGDEEESLTPVLDFFIKRFDLECYWVATEICGISDLKKRTSALKMIIKAAQVCFEASNFFSMFALYFGLNMNPVLRLKKTWEGLSDKTKKIYQNIERMTDPSRNMKNFRDHLAKCKAPIIPFLRTPLSSLIRPLAIYLKDLTFMQDGNPSKIGEMINFEKLRMMAHCVRQIRNLASVAFKFTPLPEVQNFLANPMVERNLAKLKQQSLQLES